MIAYFLEVNPVMKKFNSITDFENFVEQTRSEYLEKTEETFPYDSNLDRFLIQLNTNLNNRGLEILSSDPAPPDTDVRARVKFRLAKGIINSRKLKEYDDVIQKHINGIEKDGK